MHIESRRLSRWDTLRLLVLVALPSILWGLVAANRRLVGLLVRLDAGRRTLCLLEQLRRKYGCGHLWTWFPVRRTLLVLDPESADAVLRADANAADPALKKRALSRFAPDALVISSGAAWPERRAFNEAALGFGALHAHCDAFREIAFDEARGLVGEGARTLSWPDFERLGLRVSHQVILGRGRIEPAMAEHLGRLVARGNWLLPRNRRAYAAFHAGIEEHLARLQEGGGAEPGAGARPSAGCLLHDAAALLGRRSFASSLRAPSQIAFWLFVLKDAVELHVARTLALIAAHAEVQERVRREVRATPDPGAREIDRFEYLGACIEEQLRLWTPVPILLRRATRPFRLRGEIPVEADEQLFVHAGLFHRDPGQVGELADCFSPAAVSGTSPPVYFFSRHRQSCAGESLVRFVLKAVLAGLLERFRFELVRPGIVPARIPHLYDHFKIALRPCRE
ncbi:MAG: cytochrome P450 [Burkholderiales bacterium]|nr:cytochrome P450 [Burkholderiales bacterium]